MDDITKAITETQNRLIQVLNESSLHPCVAKLILENMLYQVNNQILQTSPPRPEKEVQTDG